MWFYIKQGVLAIAKEGNLHKQKATRSARISHY
jgi:hypothetical protein